MAREGGVEFQVLTEAPSRRGLGFYAFFYTCLIAVSVLFFTSSPVGVNVLEARLAPDAPVLDFKLPMFGEKNGYKIWELRGREGRYVNEERIDVVGMELRLFSGKADLKVHTTIESPAATVLISKSQALGKSEIKITGNQFQIEGEDWKWTGGSRTITVDKNVRVSFRQTLAGILK